MHRRTAVVALLLAAAPAFAQDIGGTYQTRGVLPDGARFSASVEIAMVSDTACRIKWSDGSEGICLLDGTVLAASYLVHGKVGLEVFKVLPDGSLEGTFIDDFHRGGVGKGGGIGTETLTRTP